MSAIPTSSLELTHDDIAARAREIWYARSCPVGQDEDIWFEAERQLAAERRVSMTPGVSRKSDQTGVDIDERELADRLNDIGDPGRRSATTIDPTH